MDAPCVAPSRVTQKIFAVLVAVARSSACMKAPSEEIYDKSTHDQFYPERSITVRSRDPPYITTYIRSLLRKKNRLMRAGRAIARRVGKAITKRNMTRLQKYNGRSDAKAMWAAVRQLTKQQQNPAVHDGIDADGLNKHYADISTDSAYMKPPLKLTVEQESPYDWVDELQKFRILDTLKPTAFGLDGLPAWFLRLSAPVFSKVLADLINMSINMSAVPRQWKQARICPVPKKASPTQPSDYRPISVTSVLSPMTEKIVVRASLRVSGVGQPAPDAQLRRSVRLSAKWLNYCGNSRPSARCHPGAHHEPVCDCRRLRFQ